MPTVHSELGASSAYRWTNCYGSYRMQKGRPNKSTLAAQKGTAEHGVAEMCLKSGQDAIEYVDRIVEDILIDEPAAERVQEFVDHCRTVGLMADQTWIEAQFNLERFKPPVPMFGTVDFGAYTRMDAQSGILRISDYKSGFIPVSAIQNPQLKYYALGAMLVLDAAGLSVTKVVADIIQPRRANSSCEYEATELLAWSVDLMKHAEATQAPDASLNPGKWCDFCLAAGDCKARAEYLLDLARTQFATPVVDTGSVLDDLLPNDAPALPAAETLTSAEIGEILSRAPEFKAFFKALEAEASRREWDGDDVPGWKIVENDAGRPKWLTLPQDLALTAMAEWDVDPYGPAPLLSPAQMRHRVADAQLGIKTKKAREARARELLAPHLTRPQRGYALVPDADTRPAVSGGGQAFPELPENEVTE